MYLYFMIPLLALSATVIIIHLCTKHRFKHDQDILQGMVRNKVIEAQEEERKRVSRELHDGIGQALYSILVGLKILKNLKMDSLFRDHLLEMEKMTDKAMDEVKRIAMELRPSALDDLGLVPAIRSYLERYENTFDIQTRFLMMGKIRRFSPKIETALYRIVQEALTNSAKYSETNLVEVSITDTPNQLILCIIDEGKGFQLSENKETLGLGLYSMKERAASINGTISIQSELNKGTRIEVQVNVESDH